MLKNLVEPWLVPLKQGQGCPLSEVIESETNVSAEIASAVIAPAEIVVAEIVVAQLVCSKQG